jgi:hypothetical protein
VHAVEASLLSTASVEQPDRKRIALATAAVLTKSSMGYVYDVVQLIGAP